MGKIKYVLKKHVRLNTIQKDQETGLTLTDLSALLTQMPQGTVIVGITLLPVTVLSLDFQITLENSIFEDGGELVLKDNQYIRDIGFTEKGDVKEFNRSPLYNLEEVVRNTAKESNGQN